MRQVQIYSENAPGDPVHKGGLVWLEQRTLLPELRHHGPAAMGASDATFSNAEAVALGRGLVPWPGSKCQSNDT